jgi:hypothetical protein
LFDWILYIFLEGWVTSRTMRATIQLFPKIPAFIF